MQVIETAGVTASFRDLSNFFERQAKLANSVFGLKVFPPKPENTSTHVTSFSTATTAKRIAMCVYCSAPHLLYKCPKFSALSFDEKRLFTRKNNLCKLCLNHGHFASKCKYNITCRKRDCGKGSHNTLLRPPDECDESRGALSSSNSQSKSDEEAKTVKSLTVSCSHSPRKALPNHSVYLDIVPVKVTNGSIDIQTYALLDSDSGTSFCERHLAESLGLKLNNSFTLSIQTMTSCNPTKIESSAVSLNLSSLNNRFKMNLNEVVVVGTIPVAPKAAPEPSRLSCLSHLCDVSFPVL